MDSNTQLSMTGDAPSQWMPPPLRADPLRIVKPETTDVLSSPVWK